MTLSLVWSPPAAAVCLTQSQAEPLGPSSPRGPQVAVPLTGKRGQEWLPRAPGPGKREVIFIKPSLVPGTSMCHLI